ncbi:MAG: c-type cytochrome [Deltaproteobacteria bacterium]|nr:c-type cytochrome [Deltaproteobacteria bacterium]
MNKRILVTASTALLVLNVGLGCSSETAAQPAPAVAPADPPAPAAPTADAAAEAKQIFATRCAPCHGANGAGDGPASAGLTPKPANFTIPDWQSKVTDDHIEKIIAYGGMAVGKSAAMPPNPDLDGKPVVPALRALIRGLKQ